MPPKVKITKEEIVQTAVALIRQNGIQAINARNIASALHCSTQPIFSNFATMEELNRAVVEAAEKLYVKYIEEEEKNAAYPTYKADGMAYIRFAKEEKELFKLLYMRDRTEETICEENALNDRMERLVSENTGLKEDLVKLFHLEMWAFVHGIATMFATNYMALDFELVSRMLSDVYSGLRKRYGMEN